MGNLAQMAKNQGHEVLGVDDKVYPPMSLELKSSGINFFEGYTPKNYRNADLYVRRSFAKHLWDWLKDSASLV